MSDPSGLVEAIRACDRCAGELPLGPKPVFQFHPDARILLVGQAPGRRAHDSALPFNDPSGVRLRDWLGVDRQTFYDAHQFALLPMAFCYPGTGRSGDLPPPPTCARTWREPLLNALPGLELTVLLGQYAIAWHLGRRYPSLTAAVAAWRELWPDRLALPHPSPRNNLWLRRHPWFEAELLPPLRQRVGEILGR